MKITESEIHIYLTKIIEDDIEDGLLRRLRQRPCIYDMCSDIMECDRVYLDQHVTRFTEIIKLLPRDKDDLKILDIGAGVGSLSILLKNRCQYSVEAIDLRESVDFWKERFDKYGINQRSCDITKEALPFQSDSLDVAIFSEVIEHLACSLNQPLGEVKRVLKVGGYLILTTPNIGRFSNVARLILGRNILPQVSRNILTTTPRTPHIREYTLGELKSALSDVGLRIDKIYMSRCYDQRLSSVSSFLNNSLII